MNESQIQKKIKGKPKKETTSKRESTEGIKKEDWERAKEQYTAMLVNAMVNISGYKYMVKVCDKAIASLNSDDEEDKMPDEIKEMLK